MPSRPTMLTKTAAAALLIAASAHTQAIASPQINELFRAGDTVLSTEGNPYDSILVGVPSIRNGLIAFPVILQPNPNAITALVTNRTGDFIAEWSSPETPGSTVGTYLDHAPSISSDGRIAFGVFSTSPTSIPEIIVSGAVGSAQTITNPQIRDAVQESLPSTWFVSTTSAIQHSPVRFDGLNLTLPAGLASTDYGDTSRRASLVEFDDSLTPIGARAIAGEIPSGFTDAIIDIVFTNNSPFWQNYVTGYHAVDDGRIIVHINTAPQSFPFPRTTHLARIENGITTILHSQGDPIPGTDRFFASFNASKLAMRGEDYVFTVIDSEGKNALYGVIDGEFRTIVDASTPIPGGLYGEPATFGQNNGPSFGGITMNSDYIVFTASPQRTAGPFVNGIFAYDGTSLHKVLYAFEETLPGGQRFESAAFGPEGLDDDNTIVFKAYTYDENNALGYGIYSIQLDITPAPCPGDITGNGTVGLDDFAILAANFGAGPGATQQQGDLNADGFVDLADFNILAVNFGNDCN